eukprot:GEMP01065096.1.p1 GENE.GEMP01065096.1~~GEMP01065096.1.p1  ORF type:complete len:209 (+),score=51.98 GEMP01065096.1:587-1213(+)
MKDADCRVIAKVKMNDKQTVYGGFTADHFVWHADSQRIAPFGLIGQPATDSIYTLATDCELVKTVDGTLFTPISNTFCAEDLDWATYVQVFRALQAFVSSTSSFWFDLRNYATPEGAPGWHTRLPTLCRTLVDCLQTDMCAPFEESAKQFVDLHVVADMRQMVYERIPHLGHPRVDEENCDGATTQSEMKTHISWVARGQPATRTKGC